MIVFRLQDKGNNESGAYSTYVNGVNGGRCVGGLLSDNKVGATHPGPFADPLLSKEWSLLDYNDRYSYYFGFSTPIDLVKWFMRTDLYREVDEISHVCVAVYSVPDEHVIVGKYQAVFQLKHAHRLATYSLETFYRDIELMSNNANVLESLWTKNS